MLIAKRCLISGRVQGVFYRASTQQEAHRLKLTGHAKNMADGRVEVLAVGDDVAVELLVRWLWCGPPASQVTAVDVVTIDVASLASVPAAFTTS